MEPTKIQYLLVYYVPNVELGDRVSIAAVVFDSTLDLCTVHVPSNWKTKVANIDPDADFETLGGLLLKFEEDLRPSATRRELLLQLEDSFSLALRVSRRKGALLPVGKSIDDFASDLFRSS